MKKIILLIYLLVLNACDLGIRAESEPNVLDVKVEVVRPQVLKVILIPEFPLPGRIYSVSFMHGDAPFSLPLPKKTSKKDKDAAILLALEESDEGTIHSPFYKAGYTQNNVNIKPEIENPFAENPVRDANGMGIGLEPTGVLYLMGKSVGKGVYYTPNSDGYVGLDENGEYIFYIHFNTQVPYWKMLIGIVHVDILNPSLDFPTITPVFNILGKKG